MLSEELIVKIRGQIEKFRKRLVDPPGRNPLINFSHKENSQKHIRIADEIPDFLYQRLTDGKALKFKALPRPAGAFPNKEEAQKAAEEKYRKEHGVKLSYDLPEVKEHESINRYSDAYLQTKFFPDDLQRKLGSIQSEAKRSLQERGINTLYMAFGFLEWYDTSKNEPKNSPLALLPVDIGRVKIGGGYAYSIKAAANDVEINLSLSKRLSSAFSDIQGLPDWGESEKPEEYFKRIEDGLCRNHDKWKVKRWITVGHFNFERLIMHRDLAEENWPNACIKENSLLSMFSSIGGKGGGGYADSYEIDTPEMSAAVPVIIADADHSQHSAVRDAVEGKSFVIEGPPGTGKSQTITNIIAAMLMKGKKVLFVAAKKEAVDVVQKRLDESGLDEFRLNLHTSTISRRNFLGLIKSRYSAHFDKLKLELSDVDQITEQIERDKSVLNDYGNLITSSYKNHEGTIHDILWKSNFLRKEETEEERSLLDSLTVENADKIRKRDIENRRDALNEFQNVRRDIVSKFKILNNHPWWGIRKPSTSPPEVQDMTYGLQRIVEKIVSLAREAGEDVLPLTLPFYHMKSLTRGGAFQWIRWSYWLARNFRSKLQPSLPLPRIIENHSEIVRELNNMDSMFSKFVTEWSVVLNDFFNNKEEKLDWKRISLSEIRKRINHLYKGREYLAQWQVYLDRYTKTKELERFRDLSEPQDPLNERKNGHAYERCFYRELEKNIFREHPDLGVGTTGANLRRAFKSYRENDKRYINLQRQKLINYLMHLDLTQNASAGMDILGSQLKKKSRHMASRELLDRAGIAIQALKPCFMMSPLSVAKFLKPGKINFDVLIIDEASQMLPEDALGSILRVKQAIVVGDKNQLPPFDFFHASEKVDEDKDDGEETMADYESVLDIAQQSWPSARKLLWHYRSRRDDLIAFSNHEFYKGELTAFPASDNSRGIKMHYIKEGRYTNNMNLPEMQEICAQAGVFMEENPEKSLGLVTMNYQQYNAIREEIDRLASQNPKIEEYRQVWEKTVEPLLITNLESVQGNERDVIFISTLYGRNENGRILQNFGPINKKDGERRLNVLFTRAKYELRIFTSMRPSDIDLKRARSEGARVFRDYLEFAESGRILESPGQGEANFFEKAVGERLKKEGYDIAYQVGSCGYRIDLCVKCPNASGDYILGIECDGASYHSSASARDRDRLRQEQLESRGWEIYRIWSTDWWQDSDRQIRNLVERIESLRTRTSIT